MNVRATVLEPPAGIETAGGDVASKPGSNAAGVVATAPAANPRTPTSAFPRSIAVLLALSNSMVTSTVALAVALAGASSVSVSPSYTTDAAARLPPRSFTDSRGAEGSVAHPVS